MSRSYVSCGLLSLACVTAWVPTWAAAADTPPKVDPAAMISRLGSAGFAEREAASRALIELGEAAIAPLELAAKNSTDAEIRSRASRLSTEIRSKVESAKLIAPKMITLDYTNAPLATVINEVRQKTGIPLSLDPNGVKDPLRKVTVKSSGPVPIWEAVEIVAESAGLREVFKPEIPLTNQRNTRRSYDYYDGQIPTMNPNAVAVLFADGKPQRLPGCRDSSVRILALPSSFPGSRVVRGSGEAIINLDITPVAGVNWNEVATIQVHRAIDETGRPIMASRLVEMAGNGQQVVFMGGGMVMINNGYYYGGPPPTSIINPRIVPLTLRTDDRAVTKLASFEGVVIAEASLPNVEVLKLENIESFVNTAFDAGASQRITISEISPQKDGTTKLKVRFESIPVASRRRAGMMVNQFAMVSGFNGGDGANLIANCNFMNAEGKSVTKPKVSPIRMVESNIGYCQEIDLTFAKDNKPVQLSVKGTKTVTLEIPFKMANVPLP
ncbi:MAG: hypothetical protein U0798_13585 [Gemmataceae bacterium]